MSVVRALLAAGADVNLQDANGVTALMLAARRNRLEMVEALLEAGADWRLADSEGLDAFHHARQGYRNDERTMIWDKAQGRAENHAIIRLLRSRRSSKPAPM